MALLPKPIRRDSEEWERVSKQLQGNILQGFPGKHTRLISFSLAPPKNEDDPDPHYDSLRKGLAALARAHVTSAAKQDAHYRASRKGTRRSPTSHDEIPQGNLFLSVWGYQALGYSLDELKHAFPHPQEDPAFKNWFLAGMSHKGEWLGDPPRFDWEDPYRKDMDGMLLLAGNSEDVLDSKTEEISKAFEKGLGRVLVVERGQRLERHVEGQEKPIVIESFGFADGISQPRFFENDRKDHEHDLDAPDILLFQDHLAPGESDTAVGSFLVYRKLEQDVAGFHEAEKEVADKLGLVGEDRERAGAMMVGRFRDGTPLTRHSSGRGRLDNDFDYTDDSLGGKCPFHAHIRKMRPRTEFTGHQPRMARRGVSYGPYNPNDSSAEPPKEGSGLLFLAFMRNIHSQFGSIQKRWANDANKPEKKGSGADPLIGQGGNRTEHAWPVRWGEEDKTRHRVGPFVTLKGGEFLFAPSLSFLAAPDGMPAGKPAGRIGGVKKASNQKTRSKKRSRSER